MEFTVKRNKWVSGTSSSPDTKVGEGGSKLLNKQGYMCCLGFCAKQLGAKKKELLGAGQPCSLLQNLPVINKKVKCYLGGEYIGNTVLSEEAMYINDNGDLSPQQREKKLTSLFKKFGHALTFTGKYKVNE